MNKIKVNESEIMTHYIKKNETIKTEVNSLEILIFSKKDKKLISIRNINDLDLKDEIFLHIKEELSENTKSKKFSIREFTFITKSVSVLYFEGILEYSDDYVPIFIYCKGIKENGTKVFKNFWNITYNDLELVNFLKDRFSIESNGLNNNIIMIGKEFLEFATIID